ncbi:MAG: class IV adenylate cyclase, partial [Pirellulales bacterium]
MPSNIEIKARITDLKKIEVLVAALSDTPPKRLEQRDTFFRCAAGRLKLRETGAGESELIFYSRADVSGTKLSDYEIAPVVDAAKLKSLLQLALSETVVVEKMRRLYLIGQTRVHLDTVKVLGDFLELEVVLQEGQTPAEGQAIAQDLMQRLGIQEADLIAIAYADMLTESTVA